MDLNVSAAQQALANPSSGLKDLIAHAPTEAGGALASIAPGITTSANSSSSDPAVSSGSEKEWTVVGSGASKKRGAASERLQIVNEEKQFTKGLNSSLEKWGLIDKGFGYDVVAVFGSQSTGKSTLLNRLFGTTFDVMDEKARKQTTKGIWMCKADEASIMVMDVEGTDGRERGEDQDFERKSALFSLASSEVLLVNIWEHQIGLYQGANMGLLKTVFEVNLGLFGQAKTSGKEKTLLMFVIRDHVGSTPLANLEATLTQDMERIWSSLSKPDALANANLTDYFDLAFTTLPHKVLMPDQFETAVQDLRKRFVDRSREDFVFKPSYHKRIPADGVAFYMEQIWDQVQSNADLDIPTQQELLAQFRCDEIAAVATETFVSSIKTVRRRVETGEVVSDLGSSMTSWLDIALARFDRDASRYHSGVYTKKRVDLVAVLHAALNPLFLGHVKNLHTSVLKDFRKGLEEGLKGREYDFGEIVRKGREKAELSYKEGAEGVKLKDTDWQSDDEFALLKEDINLIAGQCRSDETRKMVNTIERNIKKQLSEPIEFYLNKPTPDLWDKVLGQFLETLARAEETYLAKAKSFNCTEEENTKALEVVRRRAWLALRSKIDEQTNDTVLLSKLRFAFEERFRYDEQGVPRVWKPEDDIDAAFKKAKDETLVLIPLYAAIKPFNAELLPSNIPSDTSDSLHDPDAEFDFEDSLTILTPMKVADLEGKFRREADALYVEAKRSMVVSRAQIPVWVWGAMVFLGFNEFKAVVTNPLYFTFLLILLVSAYFVHQFGLSGPLLQVTGSVYREVHRQVVEKLRETFAESGPPTHSPAHTEQKAPILNAPINATGRPQGPDGELLQE